MKTQRTTNFEKKLIETICNPKKQQLLTKYKRETILKFFRMIYTKKKEIQLLSNVLHG